MFCLRYQCYSTIQSPHNTERRREKRRGLVKQTFELDEATAIDRSDDQVRWEAVSDTFAVMDDLAALHCLFFIETLGSVHYYM